MTRWFHFYHEREREGYGMYVPETSIARFYVGPTSAMYVQLLDGSTHEVNLTIGQVEAMLNEDPVDGVLIEAHHYDEDGNPK